MKRILVTGSTGFIGTHLTQKLLEAGYRVKGIDIVPPKPESVHSRFEFEQCDIGDSDALIELIVNWAPDAVVHLAARTDLEGKNIRDYEANVNGVQNLIQAIQRTPSVRRCVITSSQLVCRAGYVPKHSEDYCPTTLYGESKVLTERITKETDCGGVIWCIVRPTTIWGPGMSKHYQRFFRSVVSGIYFHVGHSSLWKSYGYVKNTVHQYLMLLNAEDDLVHRQTFYLADYEPLSLRKWVEDFKMRLGGRPIRTLPEWLARLIAIGGDFISSASGRSFPFNSFRLNNILTEYIFDLSNTQRVCGSLPYTVEQGIDETVAWLRRERIV